MNKKIKLLSIAIAIGMIATACSNTATNEGQEKEQSNSTDYKSDSSTDNQVADSDNQINVEDQITNETTSDSTKEESLQEGEALPFDTYKAVLQNNVSFISTDDSKEFILKDFLEKNSEYQTIYQVTNFTILDMDQDGIPEVILELSLNDYPEEYEILHYDNGKVYGYGFVYRGLEMLKEDGTYSYSNGAADAGVAQILSFKADSVVEKVVASSSSNFSGDNVEISYVIDEDAVTQEEFNTFIDKQNEKKDVKWYAFSLENIESKIGLDWNHN